MQPIVPQLPRTGNAVVDRALDAISVAFRRLGDVVGRAIDDVVASIPAPDDHKVMVTGEIGIHADVARFLDACITNGTHTTFDIDYTDGVPKLRFHASWPAVPVVSTTLPQPNGTAAIGSEGKWADGQHVHPNGLHAPVRVMCATNVVFSGWTESPSGTWTKDNTTKVSDPPGGWSDDVALVSGDRLFMSDGLSTSTTVHDVHAGIYRLVQDGDGASQHAIVQRTSDANTSGQFQYGMSVLVLEGTYHGGQTWYLQTTPVDLDVTDQYWTTSPPRTKDHRVKALSDDWVGDGSADIQSVPGLSHDVVGGQQYLVRAMVPILMGGEGYGIAIGGTAAAGCMLLHRANDIASIATGWGTATTQYHELVAGVFGDAGLVQFISSLTGYVAHRIEGIVAVASSGTLELLGQTEPIDYHTSTFLEGAYLEVVRIT